MKICGIQKVTLLDFPGCVACTIFLGGCNFNCPYCHNSSLIRSNKADEILSKEELYEYLTRRKGLLDGVAITGGEPLLHNEVVDLIKNIKDLGYKVKLDTNGSNPTKLKYLIDEKLVDYVAMDIKNTLEKYPLTIGCSTDLSKIEESINILINSDIEYEFRTTVVKDYHTIDDFHKIGEMIKGAKRDFIQSYKYQDSVRVKTLSAMTKEEFQVCLSTIKEYVENSSLREIE
jgi:pyruvate formate lyase activating enzyme